MLEFYYLYHKKTFKKKSHQLGEEIKSILADENIEIISTQKIEIPSEYMLPLGEPLYNELNNIYHTIRQSKFVNHILLKKYLPENKREPISELLFADFFCGAGGLSQGFINAGFEPAFVNDIYTEALETYYYNHTLPLDRIFNGDIKDLVENYYKYKGSLEKVKVVTGGPPCQGFSTANRRNFEIEVNSKKKRFIEDERNILYKYFVKLIGLIKPDFFILENVRGMIRVEKQIEEDVINETGQEYSFVPLDLDAQRFDIPQSRRRYILVGGKDFLFNELVKENIYSKRKESSKYKLKDAIYGLPPIRTNPYKLKIDFDSDVNGYKICKSSLPQNEFLKEINKQREISYLLNHKSRFNNENDINIFRLLPEGENSLHKSIQQLNNYTNRDHIFKDKYYKLKQDAVSKTITSHMKYDCHMYIHPTQPRGISPREAARLQSFPDDYFFRGSLNDWYRQIGNAVPVKLAEIIAIELMKYYK